MEEKFTDAEKMAVASVLCNLVRADFRTRKGENQCLRDCFSEMGLEVSNFVPIPKNALQMKASETLKAMTEEKKRAFSLMMTRLSRSDGHFGPREQAFVKEILEMCEVPFVHK